MARVVRKVSNKSVRGQKKEKGFFSNKWFWIIACAVLVIGVVTGVLIAVLSNDDEATEYTDYFKTEESVDFNVSDYYAVSNYVRPEYSDVITGDKLSHTHVFVFAYDISAFRPTGDDEIEAHKNLFAKLIDLQEEIDAAQEKGIDVELYILDTTVLSNSTILSDPSFVGAISEDDTASTFVFTYLEEGEVVEEGENSFLSFDISKMNSTYLPRAINYVKNLA